MSIKTEIDRIKQSKVDIISALTNKGVNVPSDASIDDLSALVEAIEVGSDPVLQTKSATPKTSSQTIKPDSGYDGLSQVTISAVTSSIDSDIKASNIKSGVNILGVTGTLESGITPTGTMSITSNGTYDVTNYASANVNVASNGGSGGSVETGTLDVQFDFIDVTDVTFVYTDKNMILQQERINDFSSSISLECILNTPIAIRIYRMDVGHSEIADYLDAEIQTKDGVGSSFDTIGETNAPSDTYVKVIFLTSNSGSIKMKQYI